MLVQAPSIWKIQKSCWFKYCQVEKLQNHSRWCTVKLKDSKTLLVQAPWNLETQNHVGSSPGKFKNSKPYTAWNVSKYKVFSGPYFPAFRLNTERYEVSVRIQSECGKIRTRKNFVFGHISRSDNGSSILKLKNSKPCWFKYGEVEILRKPFSFKHRQMEKLKFYAGSSTMKLKNSKPYWFKHREIEKLKNCVGSSSVKCKKL